MNRHTPLKRTPFRRQPQAFTEQAERRCRVNIVEITPNYERPAFTPPVERKDERTPSVRAVRDIFHARGYREICSDNELRRRKLKKYEEQHHLCAICGLFIRPEDLEVDHIRAKGMGGAHRDDHSDNLQAVHCWCNSEKGSKPMSSIRELEHPAKLHRLQTALMALEATVCLCGKQKTSGTSLCQDCMVQLSPQLQRDLFNLSGLDWVDAWENAHECLAKETR
jgi:5-methylcytosine-specific restriction endonuclease McrA